MKQHTVEWKAEAGMVRPLRAKKTMRGRAANVGQPPARERCGLCRKRSKELTRTECCGQVICDDEHKYVPFSYGRNSCYRNHRRYTLCGFHFTEGHKGDWKICAKCREGLDELEMFVYYGTNEYNFEKLENPPTYEPTLCTGCGRVIVLSEDAYTSGPKGYFCDNCFKV